MLKFPPFIVLMLCAFVSYGQITFNQAQEKYEAKKYSEASLVLDKLIQKNENDTQSYFLRAKCSFELRQLQKSYNDFSKYIELDPKNGLAYLYRGRIMESTSQYFDAINDFNAAIRFGKDTVISSGYFHRGSCYMSVNSKAQAHSDLAEAYRLNPTDKFIRMNYGTALCNIDSIDQGIAIFKKLISEDDKNYVVYQNIGYFSMGREQYDTALYYFNKTLAINPKSALTYNNRGYLKFKMGKNKEALVDVNASMKLDKTNPFAFKNRALIYLSEGRIESACDDLYTARSLGFAEQYGNEVELLIKKHCNN